MSAAAAKSPGIGAESARALQKKMKPDRVLAELSETFKALGDLTRTKVIFLLSQAELSVGDVAQILSLSPSAVSHQLRLLRNLRLVKVRREGKSSLYSLDDQHIENLFQEGLRHVDEG